VARSRAKRRTHPRSRIAGSVLFSSFGGVKRTARRLGVTPAYVSLIQSGQRPLTLTFLAKILATLP
jgi:transcriptional regulator with XRE-family HTH domain